MKKILICSLPRSGSTFVLNYIVNNFKIMSFPESRHYSSLSKIKKFKYLPFKKFIQRVIVMKNINYYSFKFFFDGDYINFLNRITSSFGFNAWVEKTPNNAFYYDVELNNDKYDLIILIHKNYLEVFKSIKKLSIENKHWKKSFKEDKSILKIIEKYNDLFIKSNSQKVLKINFNDPIKFKTLIKSSFDQLGIERNNNQTKIKIKIKNKNETWKERSFSEYQPILHKIKLNKEIFKFLKNLNDRINFL